MNRRRDANGRYVPAPKAVVDIASKRKAKAKIKGMDISNRALMELGIGNVESDDDPTEQVNPFQLPAIAPHVLKALPKGRERGGKPMAMDASVSDTLAWATAANSTFSDGIQFMGYQYLAELTQRAEYRRPSEIIAKNMTRKWIKFTATSEDDDKAERIKELEEEFKRLDVRGVFRKGLEVDGYFGRAGLYIDLGVELADREVAAPITLDKNKIAKGSLKRITVVEPVWTYPLAYNTTDPFDPHFYRPETWSVMGSTVHASRLLNLVTRPVPDILKPSYAFGGISLSQMAKPYVDNWLRTRQSVSDLIRSFTVWILKTDMSAVLASGGTEQFKRRMAIFNKAKNVRSIAAVDKNDEELSNVSAPLSGLDALQAQTQEHMSAVTGIPLSILLGITPSGLNASNEGEIRTFYDWIEAQQEASCSELVRYVMHIAMLSLWGEVDEGIDFAWNPLWTMSEKERAELEKSKTDKRIALIDAGVVSPEEVRKVVANEEDSEFNGIDVDQLPEPPEGGGEGGGNPPPDEDDEMRKALEVGGHDASFEEGKHPRASNGKFGSGGSRTATPSSAKIEKREKLKAAAAEIAAMPESKRDNMTLGEFPGGGAAYDLFEAQKMMPKPSDKLKKVTDSNSFSLWQGYEYVANVDGTHFGITKQEDPDADEDDDSQFVYAFEPLDEGGLNAVNTMSSDKDELFKAMREHLKKRSTTGDAEFEEGKHPRADNGQFGSGGGGSAPVKVQPRAQGHEMTKVVGGKLVAASGDPLPPHIADLKIPPAWNNVTFNPDPNGKLLATGFDAKGRPQAVYHPEHSAASAAAKFARINELNEKFDAVRKQNDEARKSKDAKTRAAADCAALIMATGVRPGSDADTGAAQKAYGATTLQGQHVVIKGNEVRLKFTGKKGVAIDLPVTDPGIKKMLKERKEQAGDDGRLFPINETALLSHVQSLDGGGFKTKDFRTLLGTRSALEAMKDVPAPKDEKTYKKAVREVAKKVSERLGNTPTVALQSYINPSVFAQWRIAT